MYAVYFTILGAMWICVWCVFYVLFTDPSRIVTHVWVPRHRRLLLIAVILTLPFSYIAIYPPVVVAAARQPAATPLLDLFVPAEWVVDNTPARPGVLRVAEWWGIRSRIETESDRRLKQNTWGSWPWLAAVASVVIVVVCAIGPPFIVAQAKRRIMQSSQRTA
jgi:hypothetical protein